MILCFIYTNKQTKQVKVMLLIALIFLLQNIVFFGKQKIKHGVTDGLELHFTRKTEVTILY